MTDVLKYVAKVLLRVALLTVIGLEVIGLSFIDWFMFHPDRAGRTYAESAEGFVDIGTNGVKTAAVVLGPRRGKKAIIRCHGNAEHMYHSISVLRALAEKGYTVAAVDYPGYGLSDGKPDEEGCYRVVHRLYDWLIKERGFDSKDIIVDGFSIGSGPATELASKCDVGALVLEAPFLSAPRVVTRTRLLFVDSFPNLKYIRKVKCPVLIMHGTDDRVVPFWHGCELSTLAKSAASVRFVPVEGADHGEIAVMMGTDKYLEMVSGACETQAKTGKEGAEKGG
jgi:pimeloyl-ACP methyl ester carboxylesterase